MWTEKIQIKKNNSLAALYPTTKLWMVMLYSICSLVLSSIIIWNIPVLLIPWLLIPLILSGASGVFFRFMKSMKRVVYISGIILIVQTFVVPGGDLLYQLGWIRIYQTGLYTGVHLSFSILNIAGAFLWLFETTQMKEIARALEDKGMHYKAAYVILSTMQMIEQLSKNMTTVMNAQKSRGIETEGNILVRAKAFFPLIVPLILSALISSDERALALISRGFEAKCKKTHLLVVEPGGCEKIAMTAAIFMTLIVIGGRILIWSIL